MKIFRRIFQKASEKSFPPRFAKKRIFINPVGRLVIFFFIALLVIAVITRNNLLYLLLSFFLALLFLQYLTSKWLINKIYLEDLYPENITDDEDFQIKLKLENKSIWPKFSMQIQERNDTELSRAGTTIDFIAPHKSYYNSVTCRISKRGHYLMQMKPFIISNSWPFGFFGFEQPLFSNKELLVLPKIPKIKRLFMLEFDFYAKSSPYKLRSMDADWTGLREYSQEDSFRWIHWRSTAKSQELMIKKYEDEIIKKPPLWIYLDLGIQRYSGIGQQSNFEEMIRIAAAAGVHFLANGNPISVLSYNSKAERINYKKAQQKLDFLYLLASLQPSEEAPPDKLLKSFELSENQSVLSLILLLKLEPSVVPDLLEMTRRGYNPYVISFNEDSFQQMRRDLPLSKILAETYTNLKEYSIPIKIMNYKQDLSVFLEDLKPVVAPQAIAVTPRAYNEFNQQ